MQFVSVVQWAHRGEFAPLRKTTVSPRSERMEQVSSMPVCARRNCRLVSVYRANGVKVHTASLSHATFYLPPGVDTQVV